MLRPARPIPTRALRLLTLALITVAAACSKDRLKQALGGGVGDPSVDPAWKADSSMLASRPEVLYRVIKTDNGKEAVPFVTIGRGIKPFRLGERGWRAFDIQALHNPATLEQFKDGRSIGPVTSQRGMWGESGPPLDSVRGCTVLLPSALVAVPDGVNFLTTTPRPAITPGIPLNDGELQQALAQVPTLVAPRRFISISTISRYVREVHVVNSGFGGRPTIVATYDDPEVVPDSTIPDGARPRFLAVILDWGEYGYRSRWVYSTLGNKVTPPRLFYLDNMDTDGDGHPEILFGLRLKTDPLYLVAMKRALPFWIEATRYNRRRCLS